MTSWQEWPQILLLNNNNKCLISLLPTRCQWTTPLTHLLLTCQIWTWWAVWTICRCLTWCKAAEPTHLLPISLIWWIWTWTWVVLLLHNLPRIIHLAVQTLSQLLNSSSSLYSLASMPHPVTAVLAKTHGLRMVSACLVDRLKSAMTVRMIRFKNSRIFSLWLTLRLRLKHSRNQLSIWLITLLLLLNKISISNNNSNLLPCNSNSHHFSSRNLLNSNKLMTFLLCLVHHQLSSKNNLNLRFKTMPLMTCLAIPLNLLLQISNSNSNKILICLPCQHNSSNSHNNSNLLMILSTSEVIHLNHSSRTTINKTNSKITTEEITMVRSSRTFLICLLDDFIAHSFLY